MPDPIEVPRSLFAKMALLTVLALDDYPEDHDHAIEVLERYMPLEEVEDYVGDHVNLEGE